MKIAIFSDTFLPQINGVTNTLSKLSMFLDKNDISYKIYAPDHLLNIYDSDQIERFFSLPFMLYPECRFSIPNMFRINQSIKEFKPDIIQLMTEFNIGIMGKKIASKYEVPVFTNFSTNFPEYLKYYNLQFLENLSWKYMNWFHDPSVVTFCPSIDTKSILENKGIKNVEIFTRGIDCEIFNPKFSDENILDKNCINLLFVGRVSIEKDLDILMESYEMISKEFGSKVHLTIVGDGPMLPSLKSKYIKQISYVGYKKAEELSKYYASSDIFVFPSTTETLGNVVLEAMASGLPVIGTDEGGVTDNLKHNYNGIKCKPRDVKSFAEGIRLLLTQPLLRKSFAYNARKYAESKTWDNVFNKLLNQYEIVNEKKQNKSVKAS